MATTEAPRIDTSRIISPFLARYGESTSLTVRIFGKPPPAVKWFVGRKTISNCARYHTKQLGYSHTLDINNVTDEINNGIFIIATNFMGEDSCMLDVKAYRVRAKRSFSTRGRLQTHRSEDTLLRAPKEDRKQIQLLEVRKGHAKSLGSLRSYSSLPYNRESVRSAEDLQDQSYASLPAAQQYYSYEVDTAEGRTRRFSSTEDVCEEFCETNSPPVVNDYALQRLSAPPAVNLEKSPKAKKKKKKRKKTPDERLTQSFSEERKMDLDYYVPQNEEVIDVLVAPEVKKKKKKKDGDEKKKKKKKRTDTSLSSVDLSQDDIVAPTSSVASMLAGATLNGIPSTFSQIEAGAAILDDAPADNVWQISGRPLSNLCGEILEPPLHQAHLDDVIPVDAGYSNNNNSPKETDIDADIPHLSVFDNPSRENSFYAKETDIDGDLSYGFGAAPREEKVRKSKKKKEDKDGKKKKKKKSASVDNLSLSVSVDAIDFSGKETTFDAFEPEVTTFVAPKEAAFDVAKETDIDGDLNGFVAPVKVKKSKKKKEDKEGKKKKKKKSVSVDNLSQSGINHSLSVTADTIEIDVPSRETTFDVDVTPKETTFEVEIDEPFEETTFDAVQPAFNVQETSFDEPSHETAFGVPSRKTAFDVPSHGIAFGEPSRETAFDEPSRETAFSAPSHRTAFDEPSHETAFDEPSRETAFDEPSCETAFDEPSHGPAFGVPSRETAFDEPSCETAFDEPSRETAFDEPSHETAFDEPSRETAFGAPSRETAFDEPSRETAFDEPSRETAFDTPSRETAFDEPAKETNIQDVFLQPSSQFIQQSSPQSGIVITGPSFTFDGAAPEAEKPKKKKKKSKKSKDLETSVDSLLLGSDYGVIDRDSSIASEDDFFNRSQQSGIVISDEVDHQPFDIEIDPILDNIEPGGPMLVPIMEKKKKKRAKSQQSQLSIDHEMIEPSELTTTDATCSEKIKKKKKMKKSKSKENIVDLEQGVFVDDLALDNGKLSTSVDVMPLSEQMPTDNIAFENQHNLNKSLEVEKPKKKKKKDKDESKKHKKRSKSVDQLAISTESLDVDFLVSPQQEADLKFVVVEPEVYNDNEMWDPRKSFIKTDDDVILLPPEKAEVEVVVPEKKKKKKKKSEGDDKEKKKKKKKRSKSVDNLDASAAFEVAPMVEAVLPQVEAAVPQVEAVFPQVEASAPEFEITIPQVEETIPQYEAVIPQFEIMIPQRKPIIPQQEPVIPQFEVMIPQQEAVIPQVEAAIVETAKPKKKKKVKKSKSKENLISTTEELWVDGPNAEMLEQPKDMEEVSVPRDVVEHIPDDEFYADAKPTEGPSFVFVPDPPMKRSSLKKRKERKSSSGDTLEKKKKKKAEEEEAKPSDNRESVLELMHKYHSKDFIESEIAHLEASALTEEIEANDKSRLQENEMDDTDVEIPKTKMRYFPTDVKVTDKDGQIMMTVNDVYVIDQEKEKIMLATPILDPDLQAEYLSPQEIERPIEDLPPSSPPPTPPVSLPPLEEAPPPVLPPRVERTPSRKPAAAMPADIPSYIAPPPPSKRKSRPVSDDIPVFDAPPPPKEPPPVVQDIPLYQAPEPPLKSHVDDIPSYTAPLPPPDGPLDQDIPAPVVMRQKKPRKKKEKSPAPRPASGGKKRKPKSIFDGFDYVDADEIQQWKDRNADSKSLSMTRIIMNEHENELKSNSPGKHRTLPHIRSITDQYLQPSLDNSFASECSFRSSNTYNDKEMWLRPYRSFASTSSDHGLRGHWEYDEVWEQERNPLRAARSEEILDKGRVLTCVDIDIDEPRMKGAKSEEVLSMVEKKQKGMRRRALSREWEVVTTTTREEITIEKPKVPEKPEHLKAKPEPPEEKQIVEDPKPKIENKVEVKEKEISSGIFKKLETEVREVTETTVTEESHEIVNKPPIRGTKPKLTKPTAAPPPPPPRESPLPDDVDVSQESDTIVVKIKEALTFDDSRKEETISREEVKVVESVVPKETPDEGVPYVDDNSVTVYEFDEMLSFELREETVVDVDDQDAARRRVDQMLKVRHLDMDTIVDALLTIAMSENIRSDEDPSKIDWSKVDRTKLQALLRKSKDETQIQEFAVVTEEDRKRDLEKQKLKQTLEAELPQVELLIRNVRGRRPSRMESVDVMEEFEVVQSADESYSGDELIAIGQGAYTQEELNELENVFVSVITSEDGKIEAIDVVEKSAEDESSEADSEDSEEDESEDEDEEDEDEGSGAEYDLKEQKMSSDVEDPDELRSLQELKEQIEDQKNVERVAQQYRPRPPLETIPSMSEDSEDDTHAAMVDKLAVQSSLIGTIVSALFLLLAAVIFHFLQRFVEDDYF